MPFAFQLLYLFNKNIILLLLTTFTLSCCNKDNDKPKTEIDQLPPITKIGANTAGCIINGKVLIPKNGAQSFGGPALYGLNISAGNNFNAPIIGDVFISMGDGSFSPVGICGSRILRLCNL